MVMLAGESRSFTFAMISDMAELPILSHDAILAAVPIGEAITRVRDALVLHHKGAWEMPAKVYLQARRTETSGRCRRAVASWRC